MRRALCGFVTDYESVLIDCPPSLGLRTLKRLPPLFGDHPPMRYYALEGLSQLLYTVKLVRKTSMLELASRRAADDDDPRAESLPQGGDP